MRPASEAEKARLADLFAALCRIPSPSGQEGECAERVIAELRGMGVAAEPDDMGNLLAHIPGRADRSVLMCAHMDTVELAAPIEPVLVDGGWENANDGILGADNKAALAVMLELARRVSIEGAPVGLELLFTVSEEDSLAGAKAFDAARLRSDFGYVFDHATPIGEVVSASPTAFRIDAEFHGKAAHAGIRPEEGHSAVLAAARAIAAMPLGRIDPETTANVGSVHGGVGTTNVVPERCRLAAEARSLDPARAETAVSALDRRAVRRRRTVRVRRRRRVAEDVHRLPGAAQCARVRRRRGRAARLRLRAAPDRQRRRVGRQRAAGVGLRLHLPGERHRAQPRADGARVRGSVERDARRRADPAQGGRCRVSSRFERTQSETMYEGGFFTVLKEKFRHEDGEEVARDIVRHTGAVGIVVLDGDRLWFVRQPREAIGSPDFLEIPAGKLDEEGESPLDTAKRELVEEIGKQAARWEELGPPFYTSPGFTDEQVYLFLAMDISEADHESEVEENERIDIETRPLADLSAILAETQDSKTLIALARLRERLGT